MREHLSGDMLSSFSPLLLSFLLFPSSLLNLNHCLLMQVKFEQGIQILKIIKGHSSKTCILDDFGFYEARQRTMLARKAKQQEPQPQARFTIAF